MPRPAPGQCYVRGLYSGGTFCYEAALVLGESVGPLYSNTPVGTARPLEDLGRSQAHTLIDFGDDVFTQGRPHPMIDPRLRNERLAREAGDPQTAVIILDVVLGHGSHPDPAAEMAPAIERAIRTAARDGRKLAITGFVCGTDADPQNLQRQQTALRKAGMLLARTSTEAARLAARIVAPTGNDPKTTSAGAGET